MAVRNSCAPHIPWLRHPTTTKLGISKAGNAFPTPTKSPKIPSSVPISAYTTLRRAHTPPWFCCTASFRTSIQCNMPSSTKIVVKGLSLSTSEGRLMKAFSEFGEVTQVKLLIDKESGQSSGSAYIWFVNEECAQLAVKEMNGKLQSRDHLEVGRRQHHTNFNLVSPVSMDQASESIHGRGSN